MVRPRPQLPKLASALRSWIRHGVVKRPDHNAVVNDPKFAPQSLHTYVSDFSLKRVFEHFRHWEYKFDIRGLSNNGVDDFTSERTSILNVPELYDHVSFKDKSVLELGPLDGGNTALLHRLGVRRIVAIEGRVENYIKCCVVKNLLGLDAARFFYDDVRNIGLPSYGRFDIGLVAGVLYHLNDPDLLLRKLADMTDTLVLSTHYSDDSSPSPDAEMRVLSTEIGIYRGRVFDEPVYEPDSGQGSGLQSQSIWLFEDDLKRLLMNVGYENLVVIKKNPLPDEDYKLIYLVATKLWPPAKAG